MPCANKYCTDDAYDSTCSVYVEDGNGDLACNEFCALEYEKQKARFITDCKEDLE